MFFAGLAQIANFWRDEGCDGEWADSAACGASGLVVALRDGLSRGGIPGGLNKELGSQSPSQPTIAAGSAPSSRLSAPKTRRPTGAAAAEETDIDDDGLRSPLPADLFLWWARAAAFALGRRVAILAESAGYAREEDRAGAGAVTQASRHAGTSSGPADGRERRDLERRADSGERERRDIERRADSAW